MPGRGQGPAPTDGQGPAPTSGQGPAPTSGWWLCLLLVALVGVPLRAHDGPPFPIVSERSEGPYIVSVWTDPDTTDDGSPGGQFWVLLRQSNGDEPPAGTVPTVSIAPGDRPGPTLTARAEPVDGELSRQFAALVMDHEGPFGVRVDVAGPLGNVSVSADVETTYDTRPPPAMLVLYMVPFVLVGLLWFRLLMRRRASPAGR